ncbi:hypothetical protein, partial [Streptosporangium sp. NPDC048865]|uniref:hypothetical protein n=1 Tax=Streptosporangium sp. NPDC048865 TaxID=3155766 RepID=UPI0034426973
ADEWVPTTEVKKWAFDARTLLKGFFEKLTIRDSVKPHVEILLQKLSRLESSIIGGTPEGTARATFVTWVNEEDSGGWPYYVQVKTAEDRRLAEEAAEARRQKIIKMATSEAVKTRNQYNTGNNNAVGTVIVGLADTVSGTVHVGTSGNYAYSTQQNQVMKDLLAGLNPVEKWPMTGCAEVDAMNNFLNARGVTSRGEIPPGTLYFHAETWNEKSGKWQARGACKNCEQWLPKIGAGHA